MIRLFRHHVPLGSLLTVVADGALFFAIIPLAVFLDRAGPPAHVVVHLGIPALAFSVLMLGMNGAMGSYQREMSSGFWPWIKRALLAVVLGLPLAYAVFAVLPNGSYAQDSIGYTLAGTMGGVILLRRGIFWASTVGIGVKRVLIVGTGAEAQSVEAGLEKLGYPRIAIVGFYPAAGSAATLVPADRVIPKSIPLLEVVQGLNVKEVIVAVREQRGGVLPLRELLDCRISGVPVTDLAGFNERVRGQIPIESLKASWLIYGHGFAQDGAREFIKRLFDVAVSTLLLVASLPLGMVIALAIRLESSGPVIYRQERVGRGGRPFTCLKFRSMHVDAEGDGVARWAQKADPRTTRVGQFIRGLRIDELPQLINVLRGDMSFVGPRPERPEFVEKLKGDIPFYDVRHSVKPGLTGWAQVRYTYAASVEDARKKLEFDLYYVKNHSLFLDLLILIETVRVILFREGAR